ncbi:uncharacterized protein SAPINGB_P001056 [Magnusiomyces paraingens]|uniref:Tubulin beta chain n=1 Tax=Magnusiomyces paraingens TaxID=2606893 RepID=A0A5E8B9Z1_9ASCO|nr:uncharacterized protein SAPINGB_P001056 [Saprochaete ingens]VVT46120.1 unnamed protein product [Saprochaete ingens]
MREIIHLSVGQCGNQVGNAFWQTICAEHGISYDGSYTGNTPESQLTRANVYFNELNHHKRYVPRSIIVDLEPGPIDSLRSGPLGSLFKPDNYVFSQASAGNNWAKGFYTEGADLAEEIMDTIRREAEQCDLLTGFQLSHSLGGGTGSGLGALIVAKLREEYPDRMMATFSILPSPKVSNTVVEPYNATLATNQLIEHASEVFCFDNEAIFDICQKTLRLPQPSHTDLNTIIAQAASGITTSLRFPGHHNTDLRKLAVNLVPFPRLHFLTVGFAPLVSVSAASFRTMSAPELIQQLFAPSSVLIAADPQRGKYLTAAASFRGKLSIRDVEEHMKIARNKNKAQFVQWIPDSIQTSLCTVPSQTHQVSATFIANNTCIAEVFSRIQAQFTPMFRRKAFLHNYTHEGMDEAEFSEAEQNLIDLLNQYKQYQDVDLEDDEGYSDKHHHDGLEFNEESTMYSFNERAPTTTVNVGY